MNIQKGDCDMKCDNAIKSGKREKPGRKKDYVRYRCDLV